MGRRKGAAGGSAARWQQPDDIAWATLFLASERAKNITGQTMNVDGGQVMHS